MFTALFLECAGFLLVLAGGPVREAIDVIPVAFGLVQMGSTAVVLGSTMAVHWINRRAVVSWAEACARDSAVLKKGQH